MSVAVGYRLVVPHPWERVALDRTIPDRVREIVGRALVGVPREISPDQVAPYRHKLEASLTATLQQARDSGGIDYYLPTDLMHGERLNANFVVSSVVPDAVAEDGLAPRVMAHLLSRPGSEPVSLGDTVWVRTEAVAAPASEDPDTAVPVRRVEYRTALPDDERRWVLVTFTTIGDGDLDSDLTGLVVELFDAIMTTWRWDPLTEDRAAEA